jgi:hypothetical protein
MQPCCKIHRFVAAPNFRAFSQMGGNLAQDMAFQPNPVKISGYIFGKIVPSYLLLINPWCFMQFVFDKVKPRRKICHQKIICIDNPHL